MHGWMDDTHLRQPASLHFSTFRRRFSLHSTPRFLFPVLEHIEIVSFHIIFHVLTFFFRHHLSESFHYPLFALDLFFHASCDYKTSPMGWLARCVRQVLASRLVSSHLFASAASVISSTPSYGLGSLPVRRGRGEKNITLIVVVIITHLIIGHPRCVPVFNHFAYFPLPTSFPRTHLYSDLFPSSLAQCPRFGSCY